MSSVSALKARPQTATIAPLRSSPRSARTRPGRTRFWRSLTASIASSRSASRPCSCIVRISARTSFGKQDPPYPGPGKRKAEPMRPSAPMP